MKTSKSRTAPGPPAQGHLQGLDRAVRDALVLAAGKRATDYAMRHVHARVQHARARRRVSVVGHLIGYGAVLAYVWHRQQPPADSAS